MMPSDSKKELINPIEYFQYDKISDTVYTVSSTTVLKFNVSLSYKNANKERCSFHKEYGRVTDNNESLITIRRIFDYYLSIENTIKPDSSEKAWIRIGPAEYILFRSKLKQVADWFTNEKYQDLFTVVDKELTLISPAPEVTISGLPMNKYISFSPTVLENDNGSQLPGIIMCLSDPNNYTAMTIDRFMGLCYSINSFNMYQSAQLMLNYVERPEYGFNLSTFDNGGVPSNVVKPLGSHSSSLSSTGRKVKPVGPPLK